MLNIKIKNIYYSFYTKIFFLSLLFIYSLLLYLPFLSQLRLDFLSLYSAAIAYVEDLNPYRDLTFSYLGKILRLPANLTPPFFLQIISPLTHLNLPIASTIWIFCSTLLGCIGALLSFKITCSTSFFKKNWLILLGIYLGMYSTVVNTGIGQQGNLLLFFIMTGYYFYIRKRDYWAGLFWGIIIAIKLFPGLLFFFVLHQRRYKVFFIMGLTCLLAFLLPLLIKSVTIYFFYFHILSHLTWFGDNWNASLYGFLFRLFVNTHSYQSLWLIKTSFFLICILLFIWYVKKINHFNTTIIRYPLVDHRGFCLTLIIMLLMSPLGWLYYFSILLLPLILIWQSLNQKKPSSKISALWVLCLFLINFPIGYVRTTSMGNFFYKLSFYSFHFYGLLIATYLLASINKPLLPITHSEKEPLYPLQMTLALGLFVIISTLIIFLCENYATM